MRFRSAQENFLLRKGYGTENEGEEEKSPKTDNSNETMSDTRDEGKKRQPERDNGSKKLTRMRQERKEKGGRRKLFNLDETEGRRERGEQRKR